MAILLTSLARASKVLTFSDVSIATQTVVIGTVTYTFRASVTTTANEVKVGADAAISATNFALAVNAGPTGSGTLWGSLTTANPYVTAVDDAAGAVTLYARTSGIAGNAIALAETGTNTAFAGGAVFMSGGVGQMQDLLGTELTRIEQKMQLNAQLETWVDAMQADLAL